MNEHRLTMDDIRCAAERMKNQPIEPDLLIMSSTQKFDYEFNIGMLQTRMFLQRQFDQRLWHWVPHLPSRLHPFKRRKALLAHRQMLARHILDGWFGG